MSEVKIEVKNRKESHMSPLYPGKTDTEEARGLCPPEGSDLWKILPLPSSLELVINKNGWASSASQSSCLSLPGEYSRHVKPPGEGSHELD